MSEFISYKSLLKDRTNFRKAGGTASSDFNIYDTPGHKYFKIFFHFNNGDTSGDQSIDSSNGLLAPTWLIANTNVNNYYMYNSAWSYLKMNNEDDRANLLEDFVNLLSNISSESPWYFSEIEGLENALDRKNIHSDNFVIDSNRQKITIKCLSDSYDDRIGTLLDLYRSITWDWQTKRMIIPPNLKKFDMSIFIFETANTPFHYRPIIEDLNIVEYSGIGGGKQDSRTSYKYIELHNCEIDYNSSKNLYSSLNNKEGKMVDYNLDIYFDDCYEMRYNEFLLKEFGDLILSDNMENPDKDLKTAMDFFNKGFLENAANQILQTGIGAVANKLKSAVLGNLYTFSLTNIGDQLASLANGDILGTARNVADYIRDAKQRKANQLNNLNIFDKLGITQKDKIFVTAEGDMGNINNTNKKRIIPKVKYIGNLYEGNTIANNI